ncbi:MAG: PA2169 family four-helix-bundle protein [Candidatus Obscuribacterales bacterium]|nr:PA2169 family four-helix-bundle protein [Steroidobacteraceae bacterium]
MNSRENSHNQVEYELRVLNQLIVSTLDNVDEYRRAVAMVEGQLNTLRRRVLDRTHAVERLQRQVRTLGGQPATSRSTLAAAFASLLSMRHRFLKDDENLVQDAERGDHYLKRQFQSYLGDNLLSATARESISDAYDYCAALEPPAETWSPPTKHHLAGTPLSA